VSANTLTTDLAAGLPIERAMRVCALATSLARAGGAADDVVRDVRDAAVLVEPK